MHTHTANRTSSSRRKKTPLLKALLAPLGVLSVIALLFYLGYCSILRLPSVPGGHQQSHEDDPGHIESLRDTAGLAPWHVPSAEWLQSNQMTSFQDACKQKRNHSVASRQASFYTQAGLLALISTAPVPTETWSFAGNPARSSTHSLWMFCDHPN